MNMTVQKIVTDGVDYVKHSLLRTLSVVAVLSIVLGVGFGVWTIYKMATKTTNTSNTNISGSNSTVNLDCSKQACEAAFKTMDKMNADKRKEEPWLNLRLWKFIKIEAGNT